MEMHETHERIEKTAHGHKHADPFSRRVAILIVVIAALLALTEMGGKSASNLSISANIEAANLWAFFQAKTIRMTVLRTMAEAMEVQDKGAGERANGVDKTIGRFKATAQRYETEPETGEGRKELMARAKAMEAKRDRALAAYHQFEFGSAALQLAIVLASAAVITSVAWLAYVAGGVGVVGLFFSALGWFAPTLIHL